MGLNLKPYTPPYTQPHATLSGENITYARVTREGMISFFANFPNQINFLASYHIILYPSSIQPHVIVLSEHITYVRVLREVISSICIAPETSPLWSSPNQWSIIFLRLLPYDSFAPPSTQPKATTLGEHITYTCVTKDGRSYIFIAPGTSPITDTHPSQDIFFPNPKLYLY